jgi:DNA (cytosine-5)-methyltransferase 1
MITHLDLFSGLGGFALAARMIGGFETRQFVERDPYCQQVLNKNFPGVPIHENAETYSARPGAFDLITAGFPCQPHSSAGKRKASKDKRDLWPELYRIICQVQPRWIVLENVVGLLSSESGRFFRTILWDLAKAGFDAEWDTLSACALGAPHTRARVFVVAYSNSLDGCKRLGIQSQHTESLQTIHDKPSLGFWMESHPRASGMVDGLPRRLDSLRALGNSVSPQVAAIPLLRVKAFAQT